MLLILASEVCLESTLLAINSSILQDHGQGELNLFHKEYELIQFCNFVQVSSVKGWQL